MGEPIFFRLRLSRGATPAPSLQSGIVVGGYFEIYPNGDQPSVTLHAVETERASNNLARCW